MENLFDVQQDMREFDESIENILKRWPQVYQLTSDLSQKCIELEMIKYQLKLLEIKRDRYIADRLMQDLLE